MTGAFWGLTQLAVLVLWSLFRSASVAAALTLWRSALGFKFGPSLLTGAELAVIGAVAISVLAVQLGARRWDLKGWLEASEVGVVLRPAYVTVVMSVAAFAALAQDTPIHKFIYFQF